MPVKLPERRGLPERFKRHAALRELAQQEVRSAPLAAVLVGAPKLSRRQADARAKELAKKPLPHTEHFWNTEIGPNHEP